jgi:hypothetical protein
MVNGGCRVIQFDANQGFDFARPKPFGTLALKCKLRLRETGSADGHEPLGHVSRQRYGPSQGQEIETVSASCNLSLVQVLAQSGRAKRRRSKSQYVAITMQEGYRHGVLADPELY